MTALRSFMYGKLHRVTITEANLNYIGSITIDPLLLEAAAIYPNTRVDVVNITNGMRIQTYAIEGEKGSGCICLNGAAAHHFQKGDLAIIMAYELVDVENLPGRISRVVLVDENNQIQELLTYKTPSLNELGRPENNQHRQTYPR